MLSGGVAVVLVAPLARRWVIRLKRDDELALAAMGGHCRRTGALQRALLDVVPCRCRTGVLVAARGSATTRPRRPALAALHHLPLATVVDVEVSASWE